MRIALELSRGFEREPLELPAPLAKVSRRAQFIDAIDGPLLVDGAGVWQWADMATRLRDIAETSLPVMPDVSDPFDRIAIALRLWAGCLSAAKVIAAETRSGPNTRASRSAAFSDIDGVTAHDDLFRAGMEAAPAFKDGRGQTYCLDGVPHGSPVHRHAAGAPKGRTRRPRKA